MTHYNGFHTDEAAVNNGFTVLSDFALTHDADFSFAKSLSLHDSLTEESLHALENMRTSTLALRKNQTVHSLCKGRAKLFLVKKGWVSVSHPFKNKSSDICNVFMPGDIVGLREIFFDNHDITLMALKNCHIEEVSVNRLHHLYKTRPDIKKAVISYIMVNDNVALERLRSCTHHRAEERVAHYLLEIYSRCKLKGLASSNEFPFLVTQETIGELLGITSVHVSRCMTALEQKKMIRKSRNKIKLLELDALVECAGFDYDSFFNRVSLTNV